MTLTSVNTHTNWPYKCSGVGFIVKYHLILLGKRLSFKIWGYQIVISVLSLFLRAVSVIPPSSL